MSRTVCGGNSVGGCEAVTKLYRLVMFVAICFFSGGTNESIAKLAVPVKVDKIITGIVNK